jgi:Flp pilus assembly protein TadB
VTVLAVLLMMAAAWLSAGPPPEQRMGRLMTGRTRARPRSRPSRALPWTAAALAALAAWLLLGGAGGLVLGVACLVAVPRLTGRLESRNARRRREALERQAPLLADLLGATLAAGAPMRAALNSASAAVGEPSRSAVRPVVAAMDLGAEPAVAWLAAAEVTTLRPVVDAVVRSAESGAPLTTVLSRIAGDMRRERQAAVEVAARSAGVRAVAPLAACFLPAFLLVGVVPVVASLAGSLVS